MTGLVVLLVILILLNIIVLLSLIKLKKLENITIDPEMGKIDMPTRIYTLAVNGHYSLKDKTLVIMTNVFDQQAFTTDIRDGMITHCMINTFVYKISLQGVDGSNAYFSIHNQCAENRSLCKERDIFYVPQNTIIHVLGYRIF